MDVNGSPEYALTWKDWAMSSGPPICALRGLRRPISASDSTGEPFALTGWPTSNAGPQNDGDTTWQERRKMLKEKHGNGNGFGLTLGQAVTLAGWATPHAPRAHDSDNTAFSWPTSKNQADPLTQLLGPTPASSSAPTASTAGYRLNPRFSLWLMAVPDEYISYAPQATRSWRRSPLSS